MTPTVDNNYAGEAFGYLLSQFQNSPNIVGILSAHSAQAQAIEDATQAALVSHQLGTAYGSALDDIGVLVGVSRSGLTDSQYTTTLLLQIAINRSDGTTAALYGILALYMTLQTTQGIYVIRDYPPAAFLASVSNPANTAQLAAAINQARGGGIAASLESWFTPDDELFIFSDSYGTSLPNARGFDDSYGTSLPSYLTYKQDV